MAYVPKDRDGAALMIRDSIQNNFVLPSTRELHGKGMYLNPVKLRKFAQHGIEEFNVKCTGQVRKCQICPVVINRKSIWEDGC